MLKVKRKGHPLSDEHKEKLLEANRGRKLSKEARLKISKANKGKIPPNKGIPMSEEQKIKIGISNKGKKRSEETKRNISEAHKGQVPWNKGKKCPQISRGKMGYKYSEESKEKMRVARIKNPTNVFKDTVIEIKVEEELKRRGIKYKKQVPLCNIALVDFYLPKRHIVIQADGCYWHNCPICKRKKRNDNIGKEERQDEVLIKNGFEVFHFWEHEINNDVSECIDRITKSDKWTLHESEVLNLEELEANLKDNAKTSK